MSDQRSFLSALVGDGRPPLIFTGLCLALSGAFALFLAATGQFLPHDIAYLGLHPQELCAINECRIVHFMIHDRAAFGGALIGIGLIYMWLAEFPLRAGEAWAWWLFLLSGIVGFGSFLAYLGYGYLDYWHGSATLVLLPCFIVGMIRSRGLLPASASWRSLLKPHEASLNRTPASVGWALLLFVALGLIGAGATIMIVGVTTVFVPQDLAYMGMTTAELHAVNPRLVPLIAHDRAGFGGAVCTGGILVFFSLWCAQPSRSRWQVLAIAGITGFGTAVGVHPAIGYNDALHLAPPVIGAVAVVVGLLLTRAGAMSRYDAVS